MDVKIDFSDVEGFFRNGMAEVRAMEQRIGLDAVEYAREHGSYHDVTGNLRASTRMRVLEDGIEFYNEAEYASDVEAKGYEVISTAALQLEKAAREEFGT